MNIPKVIYVRRASQHWLVTPGQGGKYGLFSGQIVTPITNKNEAAINRKIKQAENSLLYINVEYPLPFEAITAETQQSFLEGVTENTVVKETLVKA